MAFSKTKLLGDSTGTCLCGKGLIWIDGKDCTAGLELLGQDEKMVRDLGGQTALDHYMAHKKARKEKEREATLAEK